MPQALYSLPAVDRRDIAKDIHARLDNGALLAGVADLVAGPHEKSGDRAEDGRKSKAQENVLYDVVLHSHHYAERRGAHQACADYKVAALLQQVRREATREHTDDANSILECQR